MKIVRVDIDHWEQRDRLFYLNSISQRYNLGAHYSEASSTKFVVKISVEKKISKKGFRKKAGWDNKVLEALMLQ